MYIERARHAMLGGITSPNMYWVICNPNYVDRLFDMPCFFKRPPWSVNVNRKPRLWHGFRVYVSKYFPDGQIGLITPVEVVSEKL